MGSGKRGRRVGYAVIGLGHIAQTAVLPAFAHARNSRLLALVSDDAEKRRKLSRRYRCDAYDYEQLDQVLSRPDLDAVYIALPNDLHAEFAIRCARAGAHVLCEKPMALSEQECRDMLDASRDAGVRLMVAYRLHFEPATLAALKLIDQGRIGEVRYFSSDFSYQVKGDNIRTSRERGGGALWDIGIYCINAARTLLRADPIEVRAMRVDRPSDPRFQEVHEGMSVLLRFPGGRVATFNCSFGAAATGSWTVVGTRGALHLDNAYEYVGPRHLMTTVKDKTQKRTFRTTDQFGPELVAFSRAVLEGAALEPDGEEGVADVRVIEAILRSAREGHPVKLAWMPRARRPEPEAVIRRPRVHEPALVRAEGAVAG